MLFQEGLKSLTTSLGFKVWSDKYFMPQSVYKINDDEQFILNQDLSANTIYINSKEQSLLFNTRLQQFESFTPHKDIPFMFNFGKEFLSIRNTDVDTEL
jgi:hypothetical protein